MTSTVSDKNIILSPSGKLLAVLLVPVDNTTTTTISLSSSLPVILPILRIQIRDVLTGYLQSTLQYRSTSTSNNDDDSTTTNDFTQIIFLNETHVAVMSSTIIVVFDLTRGVVTYTVQPKKKPKKSSSKLFGKYTCIASTANFYNNTLASDSSSSVFYAACISNDSNKIIICEYNIDDGTLLRKIKAGKCSNKDISNKNAIIINIACIDSTDKLVVQTSEQIRILDKNDGNKIDKLKIIDGKYMILSSNSNNNNHIGCVVTNNNNNNIKYFSIDENSISSLNCDTTITTSSIVPVRMISCDNTDNTDNNNNTYWILIHNIDLYKLSITTDKNSCTIEKYCRFKVADNNNISYTLLFASNNNNSKLLALNKETYKIQTVTLKHDGMEEEITLSWDDNVDSKSKRGLSNDVEQQQQQQQQPSSKKMKTTLGPGQAGGEAREVKDATTKKKNEKDQEMEDEEDDDDGPTLADRLQELQKQIDAEEEEDDDDDDENQQVKHTAKIAGKKITTESLTQLLEQALQSNDNSMLETALQVNDMKIVQETCNNITNKKYIQDLLMSLTIRLATKPNRTNQLCTWITALLQSTSNNNNNNIIEYLQPLQNLLEERLEVYPMLMKLDGRLKQCM